MRRLDVFVELPLRRECLGALLALVRLILGVKTGDVLVHIRHVFPAVRADLDGIKMGTLETQDRIH